MGDHQYEEYPKVVHITVLSSRRHVAITVDGLEVAQYIYVLHYMHNDKGKIRGKGLFNAFIYYSYHFLHQIEVILMF